MPSRMTLLKILLVSQKVSEALFNEKIKKIKSRKSIDFGHFLIHFLFLFLTASCRAENEKHRFLIKKAVPSRLSCFSGFLFIYWLVRSTLNFFFFFFTTSINTTCFFFFKKRAEFIILIQLQKLN